jgi:hypothetical protein
MKAVLFFVAIFFQLTVAFAGPYSYIQTGPLIPHLSLIHEILDAGITRIGDFDIQNFYNEAQKLRVIFNRDEPVTAAGQNRQSAMFSTNDKLTIINLSVISAQKARHLGNEELHPGLVIHEYLGATGYRDDNYQLSTLLLLTHQFVAYVGIKSTYWKEKLIDWQKYLAGFHFEKIVPSNSSGSMEVSGGSTTTEGGGDYTAAFYKTELMTSLLFDTDGYRDLKEEDIPLVNFILNMKIEIDWNREWTGFRVGLAQVKGEWIIWLPAEMVLELVMVHENPSHPDVILPELIRLGKNLKSLKQFKRSCAIMLTESKPR